MHDGGAREGAKTGAKEGGGEGASKFAPFVFRVFPKFMKLTPTVFGAPSVLGEVSYSRNVHRPFFVNFVKSKKRAPTIFRMRASYARGTPVSPPVLTRTPILVKWRVGCHAPSCA